VTLEDLIAVSYGPNDSMTFSQQIKSFIKNDSRSQMQGGIKPISATKDAMSFSKQIIANGLKNDKIPVLEQP